jgi:hypothetical protein
MFQPYRNAHTGGCDDLRQPEEEKEFPEQAAH